MLKYRLLAALVLVPAVVAALFFLPLPLFVLVMVLVCSLAAWEWTQFINITLFKTKIIFTLIIAVILLTLYFVLPQDVFQILLWLSLFWWLIALALTLTFPDSSKWWGESSLLKTLFGGLTVIPFFVACIELRRFHYEISPMEGAIWLLYIMVLVWSMDSGAYAAGRLFGKHKLLPLVSPGKTVEGLLGGLVLAVIVSAVYSYYAHFSELIDKFSLFIISLIAMFVSVLGDLTESMFKREAKIKDSGSLIPGHGGILDRIDSLTAAIPVFACCLLLIF